MNKVKIGNITEQQSTMRGWLVGQFFPEGSQFKDKNIEICFKSFPRGVAEDKLHKHPQGREYILILTGKASFKIGDEILEVKQGDYFAIPNNTPDKIIEVFEELTLIGVRYPSIPDNKVILDD